MSSRVETRRGRKPRAGCAARGLLMAVVVCVPFTVLANAPVRAAQGVRPDVTSREQQPIVDAREAFKRRDSARLAALRAQVLGQSHPLASWVDYWELTSRLGSAQPSEVEAFYTRWRGRYVEDRLRNDWLLELGRRRDWPQFRIDFPRFVMNDDREVSCYAMLARHHAGEVVKEAALEAWTEQRDVDDGCHLLGSTLFEAKVFAADEVWHKIRHAIDQGRPRAARQAATILGTAPAEALADIIQQPARYLNNTRSGASAASARHANELATIAIARLAATDPELAALTLKTSWQQTLSPTQAAWAWAQIAEQAAQKLMPEAIEHVHAAFRAVDKQPAAGRAFSDEALAWAVRAALRTTNEARWPVIVRSIEAMRPEARLDPAWQYWLARGHIATANKEDADGEVQRHAGRDALRSLARDISFYGVLAAEDLGAPWALPSRPDEASDTERRAAREHPGLRSALAMIAAGLRDEGVREWNYSLRGMDERAMLAAAQWACEREVWDRCINTSDRTRSLIDVAQRYPTPFRRELVDKAREAGVDPAYVYGVIRQESRFITSVRSHVGASGLMQLMPATARWTARRLGIDNFQPASINEPDLNLRLGTTYLRLVLDDFGGSQAMAAAAYNAGPSRSRRWREGSTIEAAAWAETIPFNETRDYVKKVLTNAVVYAALLGQPGSPTSIKARLGTTIGPREARAPEPDKDLP